MQIEQIKTVVANLSAFMEANHIVSIVADFNDHTDYHSIAQGWGFGCGDGIDSELRLEFDDESSFVLASEENCPASFNHDQVLDLDNT